MCEADLFSPWSQYAAVYTARINVAVVVRVAVDSNHSIQLLI
jgi:hypothetical protein